MATTRFTNSRNCFSSIPTQIIVLAIPVVVSLLGPGQLIPSGDHGDTEGKQESRHEVPFLSKPQTPDLRIVAGSFHAEVGADVVVFPVAVVLAVVLVVFFVVAHEIVEGEAVVAGDEIDARVRLPPADLVKITAPGYARREFAYLAAAGVPESPDRVPVLSVPFGPEHRKIPDLVPPLAEVPGLGDELHLRDHRVLMDDVEEGPELVDLV